MHHKMQEDRAWWCFKVTEQTVSRKFSSINIYQQLNDPLVFLGNFSAKSYGVDIRFYTFSVHLFDSGWDIALIILPQLFFFFFLTFTSMNCMCSLDYLQLIKSPGMKHATHFTL